MNGRKITAMILCSVGVLTACGRTGNDGAMQPAQSAETEVVTDAQESTGAENGNADTPAPAAEEPAEEVELTILAAASLTDVCDEIKGIYEAEHPGVTLIFSYGSSGALQTQIEEGAPCDIFFSAALKQMNALKEEGLMDNDSITELLENKIVLVVPAESTSDLASFEGVTADGVGMIGLGEPESVPVGQYAEEVFTSLNILDEVKAKANYGSDVRTVLTWVEEGAVDCGVVYATDAYTTDLVRIVAEAPEGSCRQVIYPVGITASSENKEAAAEFTAYLASDAAMALFEGYGFSPVR